MERTKEGLEEVDEEKELNKTQGKQDEIHELNICKIIHTFSLVVLNNCSIH